MDPSEHAHALNPHQHDDPTQGTVTDPVCGMRVVPETAAGSVAHNGRTYYFCSRHCVEKFRGDPARFLGEEAPVPSHMPTSGSVSEAPAAVAPARAEGTTYTCPMHPEIV